MRFLPSAFRFPIPSPIRVRFATCRWLVSNHKRGCTAFADTAADATPHKSGYIAPASFCQTVIFHKLSQKTICRGSTLRPGPRCTLQNPGLESFPTHLGTHCIPISSKRKQSARSMTLRCPASHGHRPRPQGPWPTDAETHQCRAG